MKRRKFLQQLSLAGALPFTLGGMQLWAMDKKTPLQRLACLSTNDRVLIILQLHGGNDGINMVIPIADYDRYYNARANIAIGETGARGLIKLDSTLSVEKQVGLHPDMIGAKNLYDQGKLAVVQGVSYENNNGSHFRGRDISFMGGGSNDYLDSGWIGRYLQQTYAPQIYPEDFPNAEMLDPLALEFGNDVSLIFHQEGHIPTSISIYDPIGFFELVDNLEGFEDRDIELDPRGIPPVVLDNSPYGKELNWILGLEKKSDDYAARLKQVYEAGKAQDPNITYPTEYPLNAPEGARRNSLSGQLQIIANLLHGGCKTKVFLVKLGGFDTHANQVESYDASMGGHAALLYHISSAMNAFQMDLNARNLEDKVLSITTSEFGRRIYSNGSYGTDHGTGAPMLVFGKWVRPGVLGVNPDITKDNVELQHDYRQVYATILKDWLEVDASLVDNEMGILWGNYPGFGTSLPLINDNITADEPFIQERFYLKSCFPNPAKEEVNIGFYLNSRKKVIIEILDLNGNRLKPLISEWREQGEHTLKVNIEDLPNGTYLYQMTTDLLQDAKKMIVRR
jgi:uncharacterized protein (DUF1501 family)